MSASNKYLPQKSQKESGSAYYDDKRWEQYEGD